MSTFDWEKWYKGNTLTTYNYIFHFTVLTCCDFKPNQVLPYRISPVFPGVTLHQNIVSRWGPEKEDSDHHATRSFAWILSFRQLVGLKHLTQTHLTHPSKLQRREIMWDVVHVLFLLWLEWNWGEVEDVTLMKGVWDRMMWKIDVETDSLAIV